METRHCHFVTPENCIAKDQKYQYATQMLWKRREQLSEDMTRGLSVEKDKLLKQGETYSWSETLFSELIFEQRSYVVFL